MGAQRNYAIITTSPTYTAPPTTFDDSEDLRGMDRWFEEKFDDPLLTLRDGTASFISGLERHISDHELHWKLVGLSGSSARVEVVVRDLSPWRNALERAADVSAENVSGNVFELRRLTGYNGQRLADLLNVRRRTLTNWLNGSEVRAKNEAHIAQTLAALRYADRGTAKKNQQILKTAETGLSPFHLLRQQSYNDARAAMGHGPGRHEASKGSRSDWIGEYQPMLVHSGADGTEKREALPYEPKPRSRKRQIRRR